MSQFSLQQNEEESQQNGRDSKEEEEREEVSPVPQADDTAPGPSGSAIGRVGGDMDVEETMPITLEPEVSLSTKDPFVKICDWLFSQDHQPQVKKQAKPPYSYAQLIVQALLASKERKQTLSSIYAFISDRYPYYRLEEKGWKVYEYET